MSDPDRTTARVAFAIRGELNWRDAALYIPCQIIGGIVGVLAAHGMFDLPLWQASLLISGTSLTWAFSTWISGWLSDRFGRRKVLLPGALFACLATMAMGAFNPRTSNINGSQGTTVNSSRYIAPGVPPINKYRFFFQPSHMAPNERYIRTRTMPAPLSVTRAGPRRRRRRRG